MACLGLYVRFARTESDAFASLDANGYGIFVVHYVFVTWLQFALLASPLPVALKGLFVFLGAVWLAWPRRACCGGFPPSRRCYDRLVAGLNAAAASQNRSSRANLDRRSRRANGEGAVCGYCAGRTVRDRARRAICTPAKVRFRARLRTVAHAANTLKNSE